MLFILTSIVNIKKYIQNIYIVPTDIFRIYIYIYIEPTHISRIYILYPHIYPVYIYIYICSVFTLCIMYIHLLYPQISTVYSPYIQSRGSTNIPSVFTIYTIYRIHKYPQCIHYIYNL